MEPGFVQGNKEFFFNRRKSRRWFAHEKDSVKLTHEKWAPATCAAWHCPRCRKVILEYQSCPRCFDK